MQDLDPTAECPVRVDTKDEPRPLPDTACPIEREREREETGRNRQKRKNIQSITFFLQLVREGGGWKQQMVIGQRRNGCPPV